jgi:hypothetical protein
VLKPSTVSEVLHAIVTRYPDPAIEILAGTDELTDDERTVLLAVLDRGGEPTDVAEAFGDATRALGADHWLVSECYRAAFYAGDGPSQLASNPLYAQFLANRGGMTYDKWVHYFTIYHRHLSRWRGTDVRVLEIGTFRGGGLDALRIYLGPRARLVGVDIDQEAADIARRRHVVELGDQTDPDFLRSVHDKHGPFDVVIDDGGHTMEQQLVSAEVLLPLVADGGVYVVEDTHTSYWPEYGGGLRREGTFLEWAKSLIDEMNAHHWSTEADLGPIARRLQGLHAYDSVVVLDVGVVHPPFAEIVGMWDFLRLPRQAELVQSRLLATRESALVQRAEAEDERDTAIAKLAAVHDSTSWKFTAPLRALRRKG